jgi:hypothetical protein
MYCFQFAVFLLVILIVEIVIGIIVFVKINEEGWDKALKDTVKNSFGNYTLDSTDNTLKDEVNSLQRNVSQCCVLKKYGPVLFSTYKGYPVQLLA